MNQLTRNGLLTIGLFCLTISMLNPSLFNSTLINSSMAKQPATTSSSLYRHVVLFQFNDDATAEQIQAVVDAFGNLKSQMDVIRDFECGTDVSPEGKAKGFTHCFFVTFDSKADLEVYLPHPAHKEFGKLLRPILKDVLVIDYVVNL